MAIILEEVPALQNKPAVTVSMERNAYGVRIEWWYKHHWNKMQPEQRRDCLLQMADWAIKLATEMQREALEMMGDE